MTSESPALDEIAVCRIDPVEIYAYAIEAAQGRTAAAGRSATLHELRGSSRRPPNPTLLYRLVAKHYPKFRDRRAAEERPLPRC